MKKAAAFLAALNLLLVLFVVNHAAWRQEGIVATGRRALLRLGTVDPRSLMQGDYMRLRFTLGEQFHQSSNQSRGGGEAVPAKGTAVMRLEPNGEARFVRMHDGGPLAAGELLLRYWRGPGARNYCAGAESFMFEEGKAEAFSRARFAELRVAPDGRSVLVGLCDEDGRRIE